LAGRRTNDGMGKHVAQETIKLMMRKRLQVINSRILILGFTFKENCPDVRNSRVIDIYNELISFEISVDIYDPLANAIEVQNEYKLDIMKPNQVPDLASYSAIILAVGHNEFKNLNIKKSEYQVVFDVKGFLHKENIDARL
jgi:UDP-N-acetyl-D-galactosamine dehydrogenase